MAGRPRTAIGTYGSVWTVRVARARYSARTRYRDLDGRLRQVAATDSTGKRAIAELKKRVASRPGYERRSSEVGVARGTWRRRPEPGTIVHADRGSQYTSWFFGHRLREAGLLGSMGRVASSVDNSMIESFWSTMQRELLDTRAVWQTPEQLGSAIFEWIEAWYDPRRRHTSLELLSSIDYEHRWKTSALHTAAEGAA